jgi:C1A family cysteine protease
MIPAIPLEMPPRPMHAMGWRRPLPGCGALDRLPHADTAGLGIADEVDPRAHMPPALDQLPLGACTANATNRAMRYDTIVDGNDCGELSRLWTYYWERALEHTLGQGDVGAEGHDAYTVATHGIPDESLYPYDIALYEQQPPDIEPRAYTLTKAVHAVQQDKTEIKQILSNHQTISFGFTVYASFEHPWLTPGVMPLPEYGESVLGGHENLLCGYLPEYPDHALSLNSWGPGWGLNGYFLIPWSFLLGANCSDLRTIVSPPR